MESSREIFRRYVSSYETGDAANVAAYLHPSHVYHPPGGGKSMVRKERIDDERFFFSAFSNIETVTEDEIVEGDRVAARITMRCTHTGDYQGLVATGRRISISYLEIVHFKERLIEEEWAEFDMMSILNQLRA